MPRRITLRLASLALCLALATPGAAQWTTPQWNADAGLPSLASSTSHAASNEEFKLGRAWMRQFRARAPIWQDPIAQDYIESMVERLLPHSGLGGNRPLVTLVESRQLNAFAVPGGVIGVNAGLFAFADEEDELVSVLAHELGHLSQRHYARGQARAEQTQIPAMAAMLAGMLIAASGGGDAGIGMAMGSQAAFIQDQLAYSRRFEQEADRIGLQAMAEAGFDPHAMVRMFRAMQRMVSLQGGNPPEFLLSHPVTESRISDSEDRARQLTLGRKRNDGPRYHLVRARALLVIHQRDPQQAATRLKQDGAPQQAMRYLDALITARQGDTDSALQTLDALARELPDLAMLPATAAQVAFEAGRYDEAIERSRRQLRLMPGYVPARQLLGEALLQRNPEQAWRVLRELSEQRNEDPQVFTLLAEAAGRSEREGWGHLARGEHLQLSGRIDDAIRQLDVAKRVAQEEGDATAVSRIEQRRSDFIDYRETMEKFQ
ncbi:M48 family metalloprotease [Halomonas urumqiensis]|uniref:Putative beta-barrel assembly-enhancing protease n=1 Tax=Halomonas urumqiensis TaxID=1684789 RepID=A0A2N7UNY7_9GAMM|nr:M48 family metalloprotease [Halomonas urumqiensis]PMR82160.1 peptidase M48 [Halomonas urumqiensis]PTB03064.1 M48 family peptidase [Halomonas urumqiensis]GHE20804.1 putative beta-barrel assembly-enhancing protease [Halomonas urumqiensis]